MNKLQEELREVVDMPARSEMRERFQTWIEEGVLTRDEDAYDHACVMFAAWDPKQGEIFIGDHKKSGEWIFTGGHIDQGEGLRECLKRELEEEWGWTVEDSELPEISFYTVLDIPKNEVRPCRTHYDVWYLFAVDKDQFAVDQEKLATEYHEIRWMPIEEARGLSKAPTTHWALDFMEGLR